MATEVKNSQSTILRTAGPRGLDASVMIKNLVPESEQQRVPGPQDPVRLSQNATTAHILTIRWTADSGWEAPQISPYSKIALEPTASVLHYATESFEGMKAYRGYDGKLRLFRPRLNCERMRISNDRVCLPDFDSVELLSVITTFLALECPRWLPDPGSNLYVRPTMIGSGSALGIQRPREALFFLFAALFPQSSSAKVSPGIKLLASDPEQIRAWPGGFGYAKVGANYGPAMTAQAQAREAGCSQTLWLFGEDKLVTEAGASNFFVIWRAKTSNEIELVTSSLDTKVILDGITRRSVLALARERLTASADPDVLGDLKPLKVVERAFTVAEMLDVSVEGRLIEAFVSGTAMFISPVAMIRHKQQDIEFPMQVTETGLEAPVSHYSSRLKGWLEDIIYGKVDHPWAYVIEEKVS
ncbi:branched-chain amino acid aminotransferase [Capronia coronata CBS 617.96]|uniref:Branched-chain-amino-acid aminotransferase n=1 Tax=Capronia coronata CBS 617.96 TaxID=1182541 RepID=W9YLD9_9EURO|nr:branched-chain amino acid aminotransferase [Capronia coronata CBS 617.96]EXJ90485.1 branched-chain amino acid aminotransferase [Capronia coronata CBS 617.96]